MTTQLIIHAVLLGVTAYTFVHILQDTMTFKWYKNLLEKLPDVLKLPLGGCSLCFGGQIALWSYIYFYHASIYEAIIFISLTIFTVKKLQTNDKVPKKVYKPEIGAAQKEVANNRGVR